MLLAPERERITETDRRRLCRQLLVREQQVGVRFMTRLGGKKRPRYRVSLAQLQEYWPELFSREVQMRDEVASHSARAQEVAGLALDQVRRLLRRVERLETEVARLKHRLLFKGAPRSKPAKRRA